MKKYKLLILGCGLLLTSFTITNKVNDSDLVFSCEEKYEGVEIRKAKTTADVKIGKTYVQNGTFNKTRMLRFATPVYGDFTSLTYYVSIEGYDSSPVNKDVNIVYKGIETNGVVSYFDGTNIVNEKSQLTDNWYWACFTIEFSSYKFYSANISSYVEAKNSLDEKINSEAKENVSLKNEISSSLENINRNLLGNWQASDKLTNISISENSLIINNILLDYVDIDEDYYVFNKGENTLKIKLMDDVIIIDGVVDNKKFNQVNFNKYTSSTSYKVTFKYNEQDLGTEEVEEGLKPTLKGITRPVNDNLTFYGWEIDGVTYIEDNLPIITKNVIANAVFKAKVVVNSYNNITNNLISQKEVFYDENEIFTINFDSFEGLVPNKDYIKGIANRNYIENVYYSSLEKWDGKTSELTFVDETHYEISTSAQYAFLVDEINNGTTYEGKTITLKSSLEINKDFPTITKTFNGTFDGNNNSIRGININSSTTRTALFYELTGGTIKNLTTYGEVKAGQYGSVIVGRNVGGKVDNVTNYASLTHSTGNGAGAIVGGINNGATVLNCVNYGDVTGAVSNNKTAGIVGAVELTGENKITGCKNFGTIKGATFVGGIAGEVYANNSNGGIFDSENYGDIISIVDDTIKTPKGQIGGIAGQFSSSTKINSKASLSNCINYGNVTGSSVVNNGVGGIVGEYNVTTTIKNVINYGEIFGNNRTAGIVGNLYGKIDNAKNYGTIQAGYEGSTITDTGRYVGGIAAVGFNGASISNSINYGTVLNNKAYIGGILGVTSSGKPTVTITKCDNYGEVYTTANGAGGIIGGSLNKTATLIISSSNNYGDITASNKVGGIAGSITLSTATITDSLNYGIIEALATSETIYSSDIVGHDNK